MTEVVGSVTGLAYTVYTIIYIFGGVVPYIPQYLEIRRIRNIRGFSTFVCLTLLLANLLRICFWFVHPFSKPLLIQSLVMVAAMLMMMQLAAQVLYSEHQSHSPVIGQRATSVVALRTIWSAPVEHFWHWTDFSSYLMFTLIFTLVASMITYLFSDSQLFIAFLGFAALFTEALLGLPQLLKNYRNQSTRGMSLTMVCMWTCGDVFKTAFFLLEHAPPQFPLCGGLQICLDCLIFAQHFYYTNLNRSATVLTSVE